MTPMVEVASADSETMTVAANVESVWTLSNLQMIFDFGFLTQQDLDDSYTTHTWIDEHFMMPGQYLGFTLRTNGDYQIELGDIGHLAVDGFPIPEDQFDTEYKLDVVNAHWYDNGQDNGPHDLLGVFAPALAWRFSIVEDRGPNPGSQHWTGGFTGTFKWYPRFRPTGFGRPPGVYSDMWIINVVPMGFTNTILLDSLP